MNSITQQTRRESYSRIDKSTRQEIVLNAFKQYGNMTARECMEALSFVEPNQIRPRITELCKQGKLMVVDKFYDRKTSRKVAVFGVRN